MRALRCWGVQRIGGRMEGGKGEVQWRVGDGRADKGRAGCLGEEAEKTGKGIGRERVWHSAPPTRHFDVSQLPWQLTAL